MVIRNFGLSFFTFFLPSYLLKGISQHILLSKFFVNKDRATQFLSPSSPRKDLLLELGLFIGLS